MRSSKETIDYIMTLAQKAGMNQRELAKKVGISESAMSRYVNHSREFPINDIGAFAEALGTHVYDLLDIPAPKATVSSFPTAETIVTAIKEVGALNEATINNDKFRDRLFQAMIEDLLQLVVK